MNNNMLLRVVSGVILALLTISVVIIGGWYFFILVATAIYLMTFEWSRIIGDVPSSYHVLISASLVFLVSLLLFNNSSFYIFLTILLASIILIYNLKHLSNNPIMFFVGYIYVLSPSIAIISIRMYPDLGVGLYNILWILFVIWSTDISAFFTGKVFGGIKLAPKISPAKTWSGFIGGIIAAIIVGSITCYLFELGSMITFIWLAFLMSLLAQSGDLIMSKIKRHYSIKDSGKLIPGHGGILDRLDSTVLSLPFFGISLLLI